MSFPTFPIILFMQNVVQKKIVYLVQNSKVYCVYHEHREYKVSTSLHVVFIVVSDNAHFVICIFLVVGSKMMFSAGSQISISYKSIFGPFEVVFLNVLLFLNAGLVICLFVCLTRGYFNENMVYLAGLDKKILTLLQMYRFCPFLAAYVQLQNRFSQGRSNLWSVSRRRLLGSLCQFFSYISLKCVGD